MGVYKCWLKLGGKTVSISVVLQLHKKCTSLQGVPYVGDIHELPTLGWVENDDFMALPNLRLQAFMDCPVRL